MADLAYYHLLADARQHAANEAYKKSFSLYIHAFNKCPRMKKRLEHEFRSVLIKLNEELAVTNDRAEIFHNFETAIRQLPGNAYLLNDIGMYLYKYGYFSEALCHFEKALKVDSSFVSIERNLNNAKRFLFPRHYFRNLNDKRKNEAYRRAIRQSITSDVDSVLDLDTGTGLLALYANDCRSISTTACDSSKTMARLAELVIHENQIYEVLIINKPSVKLNHRDIYGTRTLLLTDMFDAGLFGDYILQNLSHAWESLVSEDAKVLPSRAEYFIMGVRSEKLRDKYQVCESSRKLINAPSKYVHMTTHYNESYYGEDVALYDDIEYVTEPVSLLTVDFNSYEDLQEKLYRKEPYHINLKAIENGEITSVIGWFNLHLTDDIMITNDPRTEERIDAWQQAVFFDFLTQEIKVGDVIPLQFVTYHGRMTLLTDTSDVMRVSPELLKFLNDKEYIDSLVGSLAMNCVYLGQSVDIADTDMIDLCAFPIFGFEMLKRGAKSLVCHAKNIPDKCFLEKLFQKHGFPRHRYAIVMEDFWNHDVFKEKKFHVIFCNILDGNGDVDVRKRRMAYHLCHAHLNEGGMFLPTNIVMYGQLISSKTLETDNRMSDENIGGYIMATHVNRYQVSHTSNIDISQLEYTALSEPIIMSPCLTHMQAELIKVPVVRDGECSGVLVWYDIKLMDNWPITSTKRGGSFIDCSAYLATPRLQFFKGDTANVIRCVDPDGTYKLVVDADV